MKKSAFIITETVLSVVFVAVAASVAVIATDISKDNVNIIQESPSVESSVQQSSVTVSSSPESSSEPSKQESSQESTEVSQTVSFKEPENLSSQPEDLTEFINNYGYTYDYMLFDHLIVVDTKDSQASIYCYQKSDKGYWWNIMGDKKAITDKGFVGENGADFNVTSGSDKTPMGFYRLGEGFYIDEKPNTTYPMFRITEDTYWVDDPKSEFYNQKVEGTSKKDWSSAEHMITAEKAYKYGIVVEYNTDPVDKNAGSAIFMHCGTEPTAGCIVIPEDTMRTVMEWLEKDSEAFILII